MTKHKIFLKFDEIKAEIYLGKETDVI